MIVIPGQKDFAKCSEKESVSVYDFSIKAAVWKVKLTNKKELGYNKPCKKEVYHLI